MGQIHLKNIRKSFGAVDVLHDINLEVGEGEFVVFVGPSGCGKSTLLRLIAGLDKPTSGTIEIDGLDATHKGAADRGLAMVFQSYALYPHMTVRQNLSFGLENSRMPKAQIISRVDEAARMLEITDLLTRRPTQLSGGQRQRVAIGRAIVRDPTAFLLDEPLSNLDAELRGTMRAELSALHGRLKTTMIYVTHDQIEAMTLADRIVVLRKGRVEQIDTPLNLYNRPQNLFVAGFIGAPNMNFFSVEALYGAARLAGEVSINVSTSGPLTIGIRPQHLRLAQESEPAFTATVHLVEALGAETVVHATTADKVPIIVLLSGQRQVSKGEIIRLAFAPENIHAFDESGKRVEAL
jgi:ABC-type sugar transport system ATPase subunit